MPESIPYKIYKHLPITAQNFCCTMSGIKMVRQRFDRTFYEFKNFLQASEWWALNEFKSFQDTKLRSLIQYAYDTVPYYHELFEKEKLKPSDIKTQADLYKIPVLTKDVVRGRLGDLLSTAIPKNKRISSQTGGSTGTALKLYYDQSTMPRHWATVWRGRNRWGIKHTDEFISFAGRNVVPLNSMKPPIWRRNLFYHQTYVSVHHLTVENMKIVADYLCKRNVKYYAGYPSGIYLVALYFLENHISLPFPPEVVFTTSETLLPYQREAISKAFTCKVTDRYAASERCVGISSCEKNNYHEDMEYGIIEYLPFDLKASSKEKKVICTGFWNLAMPLIRYDIGDRVTVLEKKIKCECGRDSNLVSSIDGRTESYIITPDGRRLGRLGFIFWETPQIKEAQFVQTEISKLKVLIVKTSSYNSKDEDKLKQNMKNYMGDQIEILFEYVPEIPREPNGKFRQIVSQVSKECGLN